MIYTRMQEAGHGGVNATVNRLAAYCVWDGMEVAVVEFVRQ